MTATVACVAAAVTLALAGCGSDDSSTSTSSTSTTSKGRTVDDAAVESQIKQQLSVPAAQVTTVKCPSDVTSEAGATFNCSVTWDNGATGKVKVTQQSLTSFTYATVPGSVQVPGETVDKAVEEQLAKQGFPDATANCPSNVIVKLDSPVTCDVSGAGATGTVTFTFSSAEGTVDPASVQTG
jgi:hypothetical protein